MRHAHIRQAAVKVRSKESDSTSETISLHLRCFLGVLRARACVYVCACVRASVCVCVRVRAGACMCVRECAHVSV